MSREIPYQPMRGPDKQVSQSDMLAILEKHAQRTGVPLPVSTRPRPDITWNKPEKGAMGVRSTCGRYSCSKIIVNGKATYELWKLVPDNSWFRQLAVGLDSFQTAQRLANEDQQR